MWKLSLAIPLALLSSAGLIWIEYSKSIHEDAQTPMHDSLVGIMAEVGCEHILIDILAPTFMGESVKPAWERTSVEGSQPRACYSAQRNLSEWVCMAMIIQE